MNSTLSLSVRCRPVLGYAALMHTVDSAVTFKFHNIHLTFSLSLSLPLSQSHTHTHTHTHTNYTHQTTRITLAPFNDAVCLNIHIPEFHTHTKTDTHSHTHE